MSSSSTAKPISSPSPTTAPSESSTVTEPTEDQFSSSSSRSTRQSTASTSTTTPASSSSAAFDTSFSSIRDLTSTVRSTISIITIQLPSSTPRSVTTVYKTTVVRTTHGELYTTVFGTASAEDARPVAATRADESNKVAPIIGGVLGGLCIIAVLATLLLPRVRRSRQQNRANYNFDGNFDPGRVSSGKVLDLGDEIDTTRSLSGTSISGGMTMSPLVLPSTAESVENTAQPYQYRYPWPHMPLPQTFFAPPSDHHHIYYDSRTRQVGPASDISHSIASYFPYQAPPSATELPYAMPLPEPAPRTARPSLGRAARSSHTFSYISQHTASTSHTTGKRSLKDGKDACSRSILSVANPDLPEETQSPRQYSRTVSFSEMHHPGSDHQKLCGVGENEEEGIEGGTRPVLWRSHSDAQARAL